MPPLPGQDQGQGGALHGYLRRSFYDPLASRLAQDGLRLDAAAANAAVRTWLREVANVRVHGTTGEVPQMRWREERAALQPLPPPYRGRLPQAAAPSPALDRFGQQPLQHDLAAYDRLFAGEAP